MKCFVIYKESEINFNYIFYNIGVINSKRWEWFTALSIFGLTSHFHIGSCFQLHTAKVSDICILNIG